MEKRTSVILGQFVFAAICFLSPAFCFAQAADAMKPAEKGANSVQSKAAADRLRSRQRSMEAFRREYPGTPIKQTSPAPSGPSPLNTSAAVPPLAESAVAAPTNPKATVLLLDYAQFKIGNDLVNLRTYNGKLVGPTLRVKAGQTLFVELINKLPVEPQPEGDVMNTFHNWNTTNIHYHGLHVAPQGTPELESDNVLLQIKPSADPFGSVQKYAVKIPADHPAGTFWYHPHVHGSTTPQVASGASGAIIVERDDAFQNLDNNQEVAAATKKEEILVLQQIPYLMSSVSSIGEIENVDDNAGTMFNPGQFNKLRRYTTVNGVKIPTIHLSPGEVRRFRFVASQQREVINLALVKNASARGPATINFNEIAIDGLPTGDMTSKQNLELQPGYRSDSLVQAPLDAFGEYDLINKNAATGTGADGSLEPLKLVARIIISGIPNPMNLPKSEALAQYRLPDPGVPTGATAYAFYGIVNGSNGGALFYITRKFVAPNNSPTGQEYNPNDIRQLNLGQVQKWIVGSRNDTGIGVAHPFHIHINPFLIQVVQDENGNDVTHQEIGKPTWRDTLAMKQGYSYTLVTKYERFTGTFVDHCHILDHEDQGMMEKVEIVDPKNPKPKTGASILESPAKLPVADPAKPTVVLFVKGSFCPHCMTQVTDMAKGIGSAKANLVVVSASDKEDLDGFPAGPFSLVADPKHTLFRQNGAFKDEPLHATIVLNSAGKTVLKEVGPTPYTDVEAVRKALAK